MCISQSHLEKLQSPQRVESPQRIESPQQSNDHQPEIKRDSHGAIDIEYYLKKARKLRSEAFTSAFRGNSKQNTSRSAL
ncbi:hypothetical protein [Hahella ganghwensis]|uniref:hypothetical protein n=1 Tax=Hahella ganghwensis TaxID=286420 RepID=UPI0003600570|nr:hypothetical protein [Hahella ganghwensis]